MGGERGGERYRGGSRGVLFFDETLLLGLIVWGEEDFEREFWLVGVEMMMM